MNIRVATVDDLPGLLRLYQQLAAGAPNVTADKLAAIFEELALSPFARVFVVDGGETLLGTFVLLIHPALGDRCRPVAIVEDVVVDSAARGSGVGRLMMEHAMREARSAGCYKLMLSTNVRRIDAHKFYESLGFEKHGFSYVVELD